MDKTVYVFQKNKFQEVRMGIREFKGNDLIDIRTWTMTQGTEDMVPTCKGIAISLSLIHRLKKGIEAIEKELITNNIKVIERK